MSRSAVGACFPQEMRLTEVRLEYGKGDPNGRRKREEGRYEVASADLRRSQS